MDSLIGAIVVEAKDRYDYLSDEDLEEMPIHRDAFWSITVLTTDGKRYKLEAVDYYDFQWIEAYPE